MAPRRTSDGGCTIARIAEYFAPKTDLRPSDLGYQAQETAGRRLGSMYREAANQDITAAKLAGQMAASTLEFPYLLQSLTSQGTGPTGIGIKAAGGGGGGSSGPTDALGLRTQKFPTPYDTAAVNAAAAASPIAAMTSAVGQLISIGTPTDPTGGNYGGGSDSASWAQGPGPVVSGGGDPGAIVTPSPADFGGAAAASDPGTTAAPPF